LHATHCTARCAPPLYWLGQCFDPNWHAASTVTSQHVSCAIRRHPLCTQSILPNTARIRNNCSEWTVTFPSLKLDVVMPLGTVCFPPWQVVRVAQRHYV
jgi:hypothetical protein